MIDDIAIVFLNLLLLVGLWWLYFIEHRAYLTDSTRERLFSVRDKLFQQAARGNVSSDAQAYGIARGTLNGMIRFAHELSLGRIIMFVVLYKTCATPAFVKQYEDRKTRELKKLSEPERRIIEGALFEMHLIIIKHIFRSSLILVVLAAPFALLLRALRMYGRLKLELRKRIWDAPQRLKPLYAVDAEASCFRDDL